MNNWYGVMTSMSFMDVFLSKSPFCNIHMKRKKKQKEEKQKGGMPSNKRKLEMRKRLP